MFKKFRLGINITQQFRKSKGTFLFILQKEKCLEGILLFYLFIERTHQFDTARQFIAFGADDFAVKHII
jgi:hypothetical protein